MITLQEAKTQSVQLREALAILKSEFSTLGANLRDAADSMEKNGIPANPNLQVSLECAMTEFANQRKKIVKFSEACFGLEEKPFKEQPNSLEELEMCLEVSLQSILKKQKERILEPLRKAATVSRRKGFFVPQVDEFRKQAQELYTRVQTSDLYEFEREFFESHMQIAALSAIVDLIEGGEVLDDEQCEILRQNASKIFEKTLVMAAVRGHLFLDRGVATPEFPSFGSANALSEAVTKSSQKEEETQSEKEVHREQVKAPTQFVGWPQNGWEKKIKTSPSEEKIEEKVEEKKPEEPSVLESRKLKKEDLRVETISIPEHKHFAEKCAEIEKTLEKTPFHEIITSAIAQHKIDDLLDFTHLRKSQIETTIQALQDWVAMSRDLKATSHEVKSILTACGFDVTEIHQERRHRIGFSAICRFPEKIHLPDGYDTALTLGKYRISCFWGNPSEETLLAEAKDALTDEIPFILQFGVLTHEHRLEIAQISKQSHQKLIILDDLLLLYLFTLSNRRLQTLFDTSFPQSHVEKLARQRVNP